MFHQIKNMLCYT
ncbi:hypothetical protein [Plasmodium yoelii yoelii]|uniref:Uncharacterized protein n=1 Tax=Plasmodium yoelii yoelii TaxID=73239 RepID=Q7RHC1_PLAYO|nr:hypothetical protein [Plasmodium yoelii yoelii]